MKGVASGRSSYNQTRKERKTLLLKLTNIYKDYMRGKIVVPVLKDVNVSVEEGEYVAIMGPSGSGKTTLMNIIGCLDRPTKGNYFLEGQSIVDYDEDQLSDLRLNTLGFVFQSFNLLNQMTALDNVALPLSYANIPVKKRRQIAYAALKRVGLEDRIHFRPTQLSGGQQQRVAIARALVNNPKIILADEPTGALDSKSGVAVMDLFKQLNEEGVTIVMITHDAHIAEHAKRVLHIFDGEIAEDVERKRKEAEQLEENKLKEAKLGEEKSEQESQKESAWEEECEPTEQAQE